MKMNRSLVKVFIVTVLFVITIVAYSAIPQSNDAQQPPATVSITSSYQHYTIAPVIISENLEKDLKLLIEEAKKHKIPVVLLPIKNEESSYDLLLKSHPDVKNSRVQLLITSSLHLTKHLSDIETTCIIGISKAKQEQEKLKRFGAYVVGEDVYKILNNLGLKKYYQLPYIAHRAYEMINALNKMGYHFAYHDKLTGFFRDNKQWITDETKEYKLVPREILGISPNSLAESYINNIGSPYVSSKSFTSDTRDLEQHILRMLANYFQLHTQESGFVTTGGTEGNFAGLWYARNWLIGQMNEVTKHLMWSKSILESKIFALRDDLEKISEQPVFNSSISSVLKQLSIKEKERENLIANIYDSTHPTLFFSDFAHYSVTKIAGQLLLDGQKIHCTSIKADEDGAMDLKDFQQAIEIHMQQRPYSPVIVNVNAGTTKTGALDNLAEISSILQKAVAVRGRRFAIHVDGALYGALLPLMQPPGYPISIFKVPGVKSIAISGHKFFGSIMINGIFLTTLDYEKQVFPKAPIIDYVAGIHDTTPSGSRSGFSVLSLHNTLCALDMHRDFSILKGLIKTCEEYTKIFIQDMINKAPIKMNEIKRTPNSFHVSFPVKLKKESQDYLMKKYSLIPLGENRYAVIVLANFNQKLIDRFIGDYIRLYKMEQ